MKRAKGELFCGIVGAIIYCLGIIGCLVSLIVANILTGVFVAVGAFILGSLFVALSDINHNLGGRDDGEA